MRVPRQIPPRNGNHVDREKILAEAEALTRSGGGNVTLVLEGPPGIGKTALAGELAHRVRDHYPDGQLLCRLPSDPEEYSIGDVLADWLLALGDRPDDIPLRGDARYGRFLTRTAGLRLLLIIDSATTVAQVRGLLPADGGSMVVVTGRSSATDLSEGSTVVFELDRLADVDACELLARVAGAQRVAVDPAAAGRIVELCDNMPFALCVIGGLLARHPRRSLSAMAAALADERRRATVLSLPEVFGMAYRSLSELGSRCYRFFGSRVHAGRLNAAALAAAFELPEPEIDWALLELAGLRLLAEDGAGFHASELVRIHARTLRTEADDRDAARMLAYYDRGIGAADVLQAPARPWRGHLYPEVEFATNGTADFHDAAGARDWVRRELPNIMAAVAWAPEIGHGDLVVRWCVLLWSFHEKEKYVEAMRSMHERGIEIARGAGDSAAAALLCTQLGFAFYWQRELTQAAEYLEIALDNLVSCGSPAKTELEASALEGLGLIRAAQERLGESRDLLRRNLQMARSLPDARRRALAALHLSKVEEPDTAFVLQAEARRIFEDLPSDETENLAKTDLWRGRKLVETGDPVAAERPLRSALVVMRSRNRHFDEADVLVALGDCARLGGDRAHAAELYRRAHAIYCELRFARSAAAVEAALATVEPSR